MKVRMLTTAASPAGIVPAGTVVTVADEVGQQLIAGRYAAVVEEPKAGIAAKPQPKLRGRTAAAAPRDEAEDEDEDREV